MGGPGVLIVAILFVYRLNSSLARRLEGAVLFTISWVLFSFGRMRKTFKIASGSSERRRIMVAVL
jgi:hypothetical protein